MDNTQNITGQRLSEEDFDSQLKALEQRKDEDDPARIRAKAEQLRRELARYEELEATLEPQRKNAKAPKSIRITDKDIELLTLCGKHRYLTATAAWLTVNARTRFALRAEATGTKQEKIDSRKKDDFLEKNTIVRRLRRLSNCEEPYLAAYRLPSGSTFYYLTDRGFKLAQAYSETSPEGWKRMTRSQIEPNGLSHNLALPHAIANELRREYSAGAEKILVISEDERKAAFYQRLEELKSEMALAAKDNSYQYSEKKLREDARGSLTTDRKAIEELLREDRKAALERLLGSYSNFTLTGRRMGGEMRSVELGYNKWLNLEEETGPDGIIIVMKGEDFRVIALELEMQGHETSFYQRRLLSYHHSKIFDEVRYICKTEEISKKIKAANKELEGANKRRQGGWFREKFLGTTLLAHSDGTPARCSGYQLH